MTGHITDNYKQPKKAPKNQKWGDKMRNSIDQAMSFTKPEEPKKTKPTWSGWDSNTEWKPESGYIQPQATGFR